MVAAAFGFGMDRLTEFYGRQWCRSVLFHEDAAQILEWDTFPAFESNVDLQGDIGFKSQEHSPMLVLESMIVNGNGGNVRSMLQVPTGFPRYAQKKRLGRNPKLGDFSQHMQLLMGDHEIDYKKEKTIQPVKRARKNRSGTVSRICLHCGSDKTPQWRTGPLGKKTLCNACGVRYKSGRLVPEYRPANSPTFSSVMHSNSHRKIMEMRRRQKHEGLDQKTMEGECDILM